MPDESLIVAVALGLKARTWWHGTRPEDGFWRTEAKKMLAEIWDDGYLKGDQDNGYLDKRMNPYRLGE